MRGGILLTVRARGEMPQCPRRVLFFLKGGSASASVDMQGPQWVRAARGCVLSHLTLWGSRLVIKAGGFLETVLSGSCIPYSPSFVTLSNLESQSTGLTVSPGASRGEVGVNGEEAAGPGADPHAGTLGKQPLGFAFLSFQPPFLRSQSHHTGRCNLVLSLQFEKNCLRLCHVSRWFWGQNDSERQSSPFS